MSLLSIFSALLVGGCLYAVKSILQKSAHRRPAIMANRRFILFNFLMYIPIAGMTAMTNKSPADLFDIPLDQLGKIEITTAAKVAEPLDKSAATVSVVTAADIRRMGARTIYDVLERLPGVSTGITQFGDHFIAIRGVRSTWSEKVLLLLNGHLINDARSGSATFQFLDSLPVDNIARIEMVRGPGSALYGANAFLGVINILTKLPDKTIQTELMASSEFDAGGTVARRYNVLTSGALGKQWKGSLNVNLLNAPGPELVVPADFFGRSGVADTHEDRLDLQGMLSNGPFTLRGRLLRREAGDGFGGLYVLNNASNQQVDAIFLDAEYRSQAFENTNLTLRAYVDYQEADNYYVGLPAGSIPASSVYFPWNGTGLIANLLAKETITGAEARFDYRGMQSHLFTTGFAWRKEKLHDPRLLANFDPSPLPQVTDVSAYYNFIDPASRDIASVYVQDLWDILPKLRATLGARYDHYSDFGSTFNPRAGLSWQLSTSLVARLAFGRAFRAPSFVEQYFKNNPAQQGNPDLKPEKIDTWETGLSWRQGTSDIGITLFHSKMRNRIDIPSGSILYQNLGNATIRGVELEGRHRLRYGQYLVANYSFADPDYASLEPATRVPRHHLNLMADIPLGTSGLHWNLHTRWQSETRRNSSDTRSDLDSVWLINTALTLKRHQWDFTAAFYNLTDEDYVTAAPSGTLPQDFTAPGRSILLGVRYGF